MILLDTNVISEAMRARPDPVVLGWLAAHSRDVATSTVVLAELAFGIAKLEEATRRERLLADVRHWQRELGARILPFTQEAAFAYGDAYGDILSRARMAGRMMSVTGAMIAATCLVHDAALATRNIRDFTDTGVVLIDPWAR